MGEAKRRRRRRTADSQPVLEDERVIFTT